MTRFKAVRDALRRSGISLRHLDGEYRVNFIGGKESTAYYTNDLSDALQTGRIMAANRKTVASA